MEQCRQRLNATLIAKVLGTPCCVGCHLYAHLTEICVPTLSVMSEENGSCVNMVYGVLSHREEMRTYHS